MKRIAVPALVCVLALATSACFGATITVPGDYATIGAAVAAASDGDVISVSPGTYTENVVVDKAVSIRGVQGSDVTTVTAASTNDFDCVFVVTSSDVTISGFTISGATGKYNAGVWIYGADYVSANDAAISDVTVSKCVIENNRIGLCIGGADKSMIVNNTIRSNLNYGNTRGCCWYTNGITVCQCLATALGTQIVNNRIYQNDGCGILFVNLWEVPWDVTGTKIIGNNFYQNGNNETLDPRFPPPTAPDIGVTFAQGSIKVSGNKFLERLVGATPVHGFWAIDSPDAKVVGNPERQELGPNIPMPTP
ncbi:MAG: right-handed parallel beta-helix repeat-containing protein [Armatimonadota bacterium]|nr:MAG: right-handed parallel beta-helix repeat-containing protein [Armatimonadota bacterium]